MSYDVGRSKCQYVHFLPSVRSAQLRQVHDVIAGMYNNQIPSDKLLELN
jgi:hypothetical protein